MKLILICTETCGRCPLVKEELKKIAEAKGYELHIKLFTDEPITSVPALQIDGGEWLDYDAIMEFIVNERN